MGGGGSRWLSFGSANVFSSALISKRVCVCVFLRALCFGLDSFRLNYTLMACSWFWQHGLDSFPYLPNVRNLTITHNRHFGTSDGRVRLARLITHGKREFWQHLGCLRLITSVVQWENTSSTKAMSKLAISVIKIRGFGSLKWSFSQKWHLRYLPLIANERNLSRCVYCLEFCTKDKGWE